MKRLLPLPIVFALLLAPLQASDTAYACSCVPTTVEERVEQSQLVFVGALARLEGTDPVFAVQQYYKGSGPAEVSVTDPAGGGAACSYFPDSGAGGGIFLVFARDVEDGYATGLCDGNASAGTPGYNAAVAEVASITGPGQPPDAPPQEEPAEHTEDTPWAIILPLAFAIPLAVLFVPALLHRLRGGH